MLGRVQLGHRSVLRGSDRLPRRMRGHHHHRTFDRAVRNGVFRCVLDPRLAATSLNSVIATASGSTTHSGVTSALAQVAVTAVAIASGACLSTKVDFLWPKQEDQPGICFGCLPFSRHLRHRTFRLMQIMLTLPG